MTTVNTLFNIPKFKELGFNIRVITSGPFKGVQVHSNGTIVSYRKLAISKTKGHPSRYFYFNKTACTLWRIMAQIWSDDLSDFEPEEDEKERINTYVRLYKFYSKYEHLIDDVFKDLSSSYIITPTNEIVNLKIGKIRSSTPDFRNRLFNTEPLQVPTILADWKALLNTDMLGKKEPKKEDDLDTLVLNLSDLITQKKELKEKLEAVDTEINSIISKIKGM